MQRVATPFLPAFHPDSGIELISRQPIVQPIFLAGADLQPAAASDTPQLAQLFPMQSYEDFVFERLMPAFSSSGFMMPARFRSTLSILRMRIRSLAREHHGSSRRYGRLAQLLDDQDDLGKLAQIYFSALLQG